MSKKIVFEPPSSEVIDSVRKEFGLDERSIKEAVEGIKKWIDAQPHLPKGEDERRLERWLIRCKNNIERTKQALDLYYSLKTIAPEYMCNRDPGGGLLDGFEKYGFAITMPELTPEFDRVSIVGLLNSDTSISDFCVGTKVVLMGMDVRMTQDYFRKEIYIIDLRNATINHLPQLTLLRIKKFVTCALKACSWRVRGVHVINLPPYGVPIVNMVKKLVKPKLIDRFHVHGDDFTTLHKMVPKASLPAELGGDGGTIKDVWDACRDMIMSYRDWFIEQENVRADESKRPPGQTKYNEMFGVDGSFRQLSID